MTADVAIISASYGNYDVLKRPLPQAGIDAEWVLVTDDLELFAEWELVHCNPELSPVLSYGLQQWRVVYDPRPESSMRAAKHPKLFPWDYTDAPRSIWIDGSVKVSSPAFAADVIAFADPVAQFGHHSRDCIYDEAIASMRFRKYKGEPIPAQADHYRKAGHPEHWGLWATTVIAREHTSQVRELSAEWLKEMDDWSFQDQVSQPYVLRNTGLRPAVFPGTVYQNNPWLGVQMSAKHQIEYTGIGAIRGV